LLKDAWALAIETLSWIEMKKLSERMALNRTVKQLHIRDANAVRLAYGLVVETERRRNLIDKHITAALKGKDFTELNQGLQAFLRLYVYQTRVVKNWVRYDLKEAENIAKMGRSILGWETMREVEPYLGFLLTQKIEPLLETAKEDERIALKTYHPTWFVKYCFDLFGEAEANAFLEGDQKAPETCIRLSTLRAAENEILAKLDAEGVKVEKIEPLKHTYRVLKTVRPLNRIDSYRLGYFYIQDKASCFAAQAADPKPGDTVLDLCAAPGAKTTYLAQLMENQGQILSVDYSMRRMQVWCQEVGRMWVNIAEPTIADVRNPTPFAVEADVVILDPPCTSTGVFGKLPAAKWRLTQKSIEKMTDIQWMMINNCAAKVKPSGTLTYSTCSITVEENELIIQRFLDRYSEFQQITPTFGAPGLRGLDLCQRLYPHIHHSNGFFVAKLKKASQENQKSN
jgi:16S rRNA (cytosine967-C5)-methyltransferase